MATPVLTVLDEDRHAWFAGRTRAILKYLDAELGPQRPGEQRKVLDIGSGAGNMAHHLAHYGHVIGLDYQSSTFGHCRSAWPWMCARQVAKRCRLPMINLT